MDSLRKVPIVSLLIATAMVGAIVDSEFPNPPDWTSAYSARSTMLSFLGKWSWASASTPVL